MRSSGVGRGVQFRKRDDLVIMIQVWIQLFWVFFFFFFNFLAMLHGMWDLSSLTRD